MAQKLVCRDDELRLLTEVTERAVRGHGGCVGVVGEAGVGKTSLLDEWAHDLQGSGVSVHRAAATEVDRHRPLGVLRRALPGLVVGDDLVDGLLDHAERLAAGRPAAVLIDDLHWADTLTVVALRALVERAGELGVVTACFARESPSSVALNALLDRVDRLGWRCRLAPLDDRGLTELVESRFGSVCGPRLAEALDATSGNPFLANEYLSGLVDDGLLSDDGSVIDLSSGESMPGSLATGLSARAHAAVPGGELVVDALATLPDGASPDEIAGVLDLSPSTVIRHCLTATAVGVFVEREGQLRFRHDLIRQAIATQTPTTVRKAIARQAGDQLAAQRADPGRIATCWLDGCEWTVGHVDRLVELGRGFSPDHPFAAVALLEPALDRMRGDDPRLGPTVLELGWALIATGRGTDVEPLLSGPSLDAARIDRSELEELRTVANFLGGGLDAVVDGLQDFDVALLDEIDPLSAEPAKLDRTAGAALLVAMAGRFDSAQAVIGWVSAAPASDDPYRTSFVETVQAFLAAGFGRFEQAADHARRARTATIADTVHRLGVAVPAVALAVAATHLGDLDGANATITDALTQTRQPRWGVPLLHAHQATVHYRAGRWDDTLTELDAARDAAREADVDLGPFFPTEALRGLISTARGDTGYADERVDRHSTVGGNAGSLWQSWQLWADGVAAEATGELASLMPSIHDSVAVAEETNTPFRLLTGGADMAWWAVQAGEPKLGGRIAAHLQALSANTDSAVVAAIHQWACGAIAGDHLLIAAASQELTDLGYLTEGVRAGICSTLVAAQTDPDAARTAAHLAFERGRRLGAEQWQRQLRAALRSVGIDVRGRRAPRQARFGWDSLTPSETRVVNLLGDGLSNREIAEQLVVSRRTVESHLRRVYRKLDLTSRPQLLRAVLDHNGRQHESSNRDPVVGARPPPPP